jgi:predicted HD phosphohydrolase
MVVLGDNEFRPLWLRDNCQCHEVAEFELSPYARDAGRLRRYDDIGKVEGLETPDLEHYRPVLAATMRV